MGRHPKGYTSSGAKIKSITGGWSYRGYVEVPELGIIIVNPCGTEAAEGTRVKDHKRDCNKFGYNYITLEEKKDRIDIESKTMIRPEADSMFAEKYVDIYAKVDSTHKVCMLKDYLNTANFDKVRHQVALSILKTGALLSNTECVVIECLNYNDIAEVDAVVTALVREWYYTDESIRKDVDVELKDFNDMTAKEAKTYKAQPFPSLLNSLVKLLIKNNLSRIGKNVDEIKTLVTQGIQQTNYLDGMFDEAQFNVLVLKEDAIQNRTLYNNMNGSDNINIMNNCNSDAELKGQLESMHADLKIMNPPYGKDGRMATAILKSVCEAQEDGLVISLNEPVSFDKPGVNEHLIDYVELTEEQTRQAFPDAGLKALGIGVLAPNITVPEADRIHTHHKIPTINDIIYWVEKYNEGQDLIVEAVLNRTPTDENKRKIASKKYFLYGVWDMGGTYVLSSDQNKLIQDLNYDRRDLIWAGQINKNGNDVYAWYLGSNEGRDNVRDVFFSDPETGLFKCLRENSSQLQQRRKNMWDMLFVLHGSYDWNTIRNHPLWNVSPDEAVCSVLEEDPNGKEIVKLYRHWKEAKNEAK